MNSIVFFKEELSANNRIVITGERARYIHEWHDLREGVEVRAGIWSGPRGTAKVLVNEKEKIEFEIDCRKPPLTKIPSILIVAVPRPQTVKKAIQAAFSFGVQALHLIQSENVVPSYLSSKTLQPVGIQGEMLKAMEQTCDTIPLEIHIHSKWYVFAKETLPALSDRIERKYIAHTRSDNVTLTKSPSSISAIGPESGWTENEVAKFIECGFQVVSLGERMLRVEHAIAKMLAFSGG